MEEISSSLIYDRVPPLSAKHPWLVAQSIEDDQQRDLFFCTLHNELPHYRCQIPHLLDQRIRGFFHGWIILSNHPNNNKWSLWNQPTCNIINLPTLILDDGDYESIRECCLSAPPNNPTSILLLTRTNKPTFVFCRLNHKRKNFIRWTEMSYASQLKRLTFNGKLVTSLACCNRKVYALSCDNSVARIFLQVDILVKDKEVVINLLVFGSCPFPDRSDVMMQAYLKGSSTDLFFIIIYFEEEQKIPIDVYLYKSDMTCIWEERECLKYWDLSDFTTPKEVPNDLLNFLDIGVETWELIYDLKDAIFFVDLGRYQSISYSRVMASELGGFIHIRGDMDETIYSYHVKNDTISLFPIPSPILPTSQLSIWESRLKNDLGEAKCLVDSKVQMENNNEILLRSGTDDVVKYNESHLLNAPFHILETIMEFCVGVDYMHFRATCKQCHLAAPLRLQTSSVVSPWLMVVDSKRGVLTSTDPMLGDNYFMKRSIISSVIDNKFYGSRFGWLLFGSQVLHCLVFFNPFTNDIRDLPDEEYYFESLCFSAPPTSLDCMVVGFTERGVDILFVNREQTWRTLRIGLDPCAISFPTFYGRGLYALGKEGQLIVFNNLDKEDYSWKFVEAEAPKGSGTSSTQYFLTDCNQHLLLVSVGKFGGPVEVFKLNEFKQEWEKIDSVGKHTIYICGTSCLCIEAKVPKMENKVFFPRLHTKNMKILFYSLDTCKYYTFDGENLQEYVGDLFGTTYHLSHSTWIGPS